MKVDQNIEVIMRDGSTEYASDVMETLIASAVSSAIIETRDDSDFKKRSYIKMLSEMIADHLESSTKIKIHPKRIITEFKAQLKFS